MYRFVLSPAWLGRLAAALALAVVMSLLGIWQLDRYEQRSAVNQRIESAGAAQAAALDQVVPPPPPGSNLGPAPPESAGWRLVTVTGEYDRQHELLVRGRTVAGQVGVEVVTPLVLPDGSAVLVDRGWVPPAATGAADRPEVPPAPPGEVTVLGRVRPAERPATVTERDGALDTRRISTGEVAPRLPHRLYDGYLLLDTQQPPADQRLTPVPPQRENAWLNAGYAVQWWIFAGLVLAGFGWLARREAHRPVAEGRGGSETSPDPARDGSGSDPGRVGGRIRADRSPPPPPSASVSS